MTEIKVSDLAAKIRNAEPLTNAERECVATLLKFSETIGAGIGAARSYGGVVTLAGWKEGEDSENGDTPMFFVIVCDDPRPDTWAAVQAALNDDDALTPQPAPTQIPADAWAAIRAARKHLDGTPVVFSQRDKDAVLRQLERIEQKYNPLEQSQPAPSADTGIPVSGLTPAPDALREALEIALANWDAQVKEFAPGMTIDKPARTEGEHIALTYIICARQARAALAEAGA